MAYRLITCPEIAHLELIEYEDHPCGMLIQACSRFRPPGAVTCPRTCAARLDRRDRERVEAIALGAASVDFSIVFDDDTQVG
jgi:hypothetical protein